MSEIIPFKPEDISASVRAAVTGLYDYENAGKALDWLRKLQADAARMDWLCKHTEFRFSIFDSATKKFLRENNAMGVVIRPVVDAAMERYPNP